MRVILASNGTLGDTLPFVAIGREFSRRGHTVTLLGNGAYRAVVDGAGLDFGQLISAEEGRRQAADRVHWRKPRYAMREGFKNLLADVPTTYREIAERYEPGRTVVVATGIMFGARIACEKLGIPGVTVHLQPAAFRSETDPVFWPRLRLRPLARAVYRITDAVVDAYAADSINRFRGSIGLAPVRRIMDRWWNSPDLVIGAFPEFLAPQRDAWSDEVMFAGFAEHATESAQHEDERLRAFLDRNPRPVAISTTSSVADARAFVDSALGAVRSNGLPAVILTPRAEDVPSSLPANVAHFPYVSHTRLLPHAAALVHNGGIGTVAAALRAGTPQLIVPRILDQPDNARRLRRLGVAANVGWRRFRPQRAAAELKRLVESGDVARQCARLAAVCREQNAPAAVADAVERLFSSRAESAAARNDVAGAPRS